MKIFPLFEESGADDGNSWNNLEKEELNYFRECLERQQNVGVIKPLWNQGKKNSIVPLLASIQLRRLLGSTLMK